MCPIGFLMLGSTCTTCRAIRPPHADQPAAGGEPRLGTRDPPTNDPHVPPACPGRPPGRAGHRPTTSRRRRPGPNRRLGWPSTACASFEHETPTQADHEPGMDAAGDHADPGHPSHTAACPTPRSRTSLRPDTAHAATHRHRTPTPDTGQRTPGRSDARTGHWTAVPWTGKRGHWSLAPDTGHRTPAEDVDRVTKARPASGPPGPPRRATARWDAQPCSCGWRLRRSTAHAGSAGRPPSSAR
jgi:hypothetical protein